MIVQHTVGLGNITNSLSQISYLTFKFSRARHALNWRID